jgi:hypothetical protein
MESGGDTMSSSLDFSLPVLISRLITYVLEGCREYTGSLVYYLNHWVSHYEKEFYVLHRNSVVVNARVYHHPCFRYGHWLFAKTR